MYRLMFQGFNFLVGLFIAAIGGADVFGTISLLIVNAALLLLITGLGTDQAIVWHGATKKLAANKLFTFSFFAALFQILFFLCIAFFFLNNSGKSLLSHSSDYKIFYFELAYFSGIVLVEKYVSLLYAEHKTEICNILLAFVTFIALLILILAKINDSASQLINPFQFFCLLPAAQALVIAFYFHYNTHLRIAAVNRQDLNSLFNFSILVFITNIIQFLAYRADYWIIDYYSPGESQLGIYAQANRFASLLWIIPNIIAGLMAPLISSPQKSFDAGDLAGITRVFNFLNLFIAGLIIFSSYVIYTFFLTTDFLYGFKPLLLMLPGFYFFCITLFLAAYFSAKNLLWINLAGSAICFLLIVTLDFILIPSMGIKGAAIANTIAYTASAVFTLALFLKTSKLSVADILLIKKSDWNLLSKLRA